MTSREILGEDMRLRVGDLVVIAILVGCAGVSRWMSLGVLCAGVFFVVISVFRGGIND